MGLCVSNKYLYMQSVAWNVVQIPLIQCFALTLSFPVMPYGVIDFRILQELQKSLSLRELISFVLL